MTEAEIQRSRTDAESRQKNVSMAESFFNQQMAATAAASAAARQQTSIMSYFGGRTAIRQRSAAPNYLAYYSGQAGDISFDARGTPVANVETVQPASLELGQPLGQHFWTNESHFKTVGKITKGWMKSTRAGRT